MRWLHNILLALTVIICSLWLASYIWWIYVAVPLGSNNAFFSLHQVRGHFQLIVYIHYPDSPPTGFTMPTLVELESTIIPDSVLRPQMFEFNRFDLIRSANWRMNGFTAGVPHWLLASILMASLVLFWIRRRQKKATFPRCSSCGYDVRGLTCAQCPECGASIKEFLAE